MTKFEASRPNVTGPGIRVLSQPKLRRRMSSSRSRRDASGDLTRSWGASARALNLDLRRYFDTHPSKPTLRFVSKGRTCGLEQPDQTATRTLKPTRKVAAARRQRHPVLRADKNGSGRTGLHGLRQSSLSKSLRAWCAGETRVRNTLESKPEAL